MPKWRMKRMTEHKHFNNLVCPSCGQILKEHFILNNCVCLCGFKFKNGTYFKKVFENDIIRKRKEIERKKKEVEKELSLLYRKIRNATITIKG